MRCNPVIWTWMPLQSACCLKLILRCMPFWVWLATTGGSLRGLHTLHSHSMNTSLEREPEGSQSMCHFQKMASRLLKCWNMCVWPAPILAFGDCTKPFLLETVVSREGLGAVLLQKQVDGWDHPVTYGSRALMPHEKNYHSTKLKFVVLKWAVTEHFKEYLPYKPFLVKADNNSLTYIMTTPDLDAMGHQWVVAFVWFNMKLEYQKGHDNTVADTLSQVTTWLDPGKMRSILDGVTLGTMCWAKVHNPAIVKGNHWLEQEVHVTTGHALVQMHVTDWAEAQKEDPMLSTVLDWLKTQKKTDLKAFLAEYTSSEEGQLILWN